MVDWKDPLHIKQLEKHKLALEMVWLVMVVLSAILATYILIVRP